MALFPSWSGSASPSSYTCSPTCDRTWCSATTGRTFPAPTTTWSAAFAGGSTQYRRVSGRKNWNADLLRYGRCVAYADCWEQDTPHPHNLEHRAARLAFEGFSDIRHATTSSRREH